MERSGEEWSQVECWRGVEKSGLDWKGVESSTTPLSHLHTIIILTLALTITQTQNHTPILTHAPHRLIREQAKGRSRRGGATTRLGEEVGCARQGRDQGHS